MLGVAAAQASRSRDYESQTVTAEAVLGMRAYHAHT